MISHDDGNDVMQTHDGIMSSFEDLVNTISTGWRRNRKGTLSVESLCNTRPVAQNTFKPVRCTPAKKKKKKKKRGAAGEGRY